MRYAFHLKLLISFISMDGLGETYGGVEVYFGTRAIEELFEDLEVSALDANGAGGGH
jgi:hypothetical protein